MAFLLSSVLIKTEKSQPSTKSSKKHHQSTFVVNGHAVWPLEISIDEDHTLGSIIVRSLYFRACSPVTPVDLPEQSDHDKSLFDIVLSSAALHMPLVKLYFWLIGTMDMLIGLHARLCVIFKRKLC